MIPYLNKESINQYPRPSHSKLKFTFFKLVYFFPKNLKKNLLASNSFDLYWKFYSYYAYGENVNQQNICWGGQKRYLISQQFNLAKTFPELTKPPIRNELYYKL